MVLLGGLEVLAAGYLINRHIKNKEEKQRLEIEALNLEEQSYRIHSPDRAGPGQRRRRHSHDREHDRDRERSRERRHRRRESPDRKYTYDRRERDDRRNDKRRSREDVRDDKRRSQEDVRHPNAPPPKGYYAPQERAQVHQPVYQSTGAPPAQWVPPPPPPPPQQRMHNPPIITTSSSSAHHPQTYQSHQQSLPPLHPTFANEPYAYPPEKLPESMLTPGAPTRGRSSSAPGNIYDSPRANASRVRLAVPGEEELTIPGETNDPPPAYEEIGGRH